MWICLVVADGVCIGRDADSCFLTADPDVTACERHQSLHHGFVFAFSWCFGPRFCRLALIAFRRARRYSFWVDKPWLRPKIATQLARPGNGNPFAEKLEFVRFARGL